MEGTSADVQLLLASARQEIATLKNDRRLKSSFVGDRGAALRQHVLDLIGASEYRLGLAPDDEAPDWSKQSFSRLLRDVMLNLRAAHAAMPWLAATQAPNINLGSLYLIEDFALALVQTKVDLVTVPDVEFMYSTESWPFWKLISETPDFTPKADRSPIVLYYPLGDDNRLLMHPIFSHELGHPGVQQASLVGHTAAQLARDPEFETALGNAVTTMRSIWRANSDSETARTLQVSLSCWIEELLCDHLAIEASGPAFLWAFAAFVLPQSYSDAYPAYPPNTVRTKLALDLLDQRGWRDYMITTAPETTRWLDGVGADAEGDLPPQYSFVRDQVLRRSDLLREVAAEHVGEGSLKPDLVIAEASEAAALLRQLILPVGSKRPLAPKSILLGGWQEALRAHGDSPKGLVAALNDEPLQDLVGKAIEMSVVVSSWEKQ